MRETGESQPPAHFVLREKGKFKKRKKPGKAPGGEKGKKISAQGGEKEKKALDKGENVI